ncbi:MAG: DUF4296 domain-containing protein, partial [Bacteroidota bacterium]
MQELKVMQFINKSLLFGVTLFLCVSCSQGEEKLPANILNKEEMVRVLIDIQLADAAVNLSNYGQTKLPADKDKLFEKIYSDHKMNRKKFEESFLYYTNHPDKFEKIYDEVI